MADRLEAWLDADEGGAFDWAAWLTNGQPPWLGPDERGADWIWRAIEVRGHASSLAYRVASRLAEFFDLMPERFQADRHDPAAAVSAALWLAARLAMPDVLGRPLAALLARWGATPAPPRVTDVSRADLLLAVGRNPIDHRFRESWQRILEGNDHQFKSKWWRDEAAIALAAIAGRPEHAQAELPTAEGLARLLKLQARSVANVAETDLLLRSHTFIEFIDQLKSEFDKHDSGHLLALAAEKCDHLDGWAMPLVLLYERLDLSTVLMWSGLKSLLKQSLREVPPVLRISANSRWKRYVVRIEEDSELDMFLREVASAIGGALRRFTTDAAVLAAAHHRVKQEGSPSSALADLAEMTRTILADRVGATALKRLDCSSIENNIIKPALAVA